MPRLTESSAWRTLATHRDTLRAVPMRRLFAVDAKRFDRFSQRSVEFGKLLANRVLAEVESSAAGAQHDASTAALIDSLLQERNLGP